jgi:S-methylmethionine-dependent homocysteine/selenocysteine methylase
LGHESLLIGLGVNCTAPPIVRGLLEELRVGWQLEYSSIVPEESSGQWLVSSIDREPFMLFCYPNRGEQYDAATFSWGPQMQFDDLHSLYPCRASGDSESTSESCNTREYGVAQGVALWYRAGARMIGGCCRTGPLGKFDPYHSTRVFIL